jgi:two-component system KDP operon response regulator KdpE
MTTLLVVEDERPFLRALQLTLQSHGYSVLTATTGSAALATAAEDDIDAVILDLGLPDMDGQEVLKRLRASSNVPILVLSARHTSAQKVAALDAGADDYVTKPFGLAELLARIRAVVRRAPATAEPGVIETDSFSLDFPAGRATHAGEEVRLTPTEWKMLYVLARTPGRLVPHHDALTEVWGPSYVKDAHYLRVYMAQLRRKLEDDPANPRHLITEPGIGYRLDL